MRNLCAEPKVRIRFTFSQAFQNGRGQAGRKYVERPFLDRRPASEDLYYTLQHPAM